MVLEAIPPQCSHTLSSPLTAADRERKRKKRKTEIKRQTERERPAKREKEREKMKEREKAFSFSCHTKTPSKPLILACSPVTNHGISLQAFHTGV